MKRTVRGRTGLDRALLNVEELPATHHACTDTHFLIQGSGELGDELPIRSVHYHHDLEISEKKTGN